MKRKRNPRGKPPSKKAAGKSGRRGSASKRTAKLIDDVAKILAEDYLAEVEEAEGIVSGFREGRSRAELISEDEIREHLSPGTDSAWRMLANEHGKGKHGILADYLIEACLRNAGFYEELKKQGHKPPPECDDSGPPGHSDGLCAGLLLRQLEEAVLGADGDFFRILAGMVEKERVEGGKHYEPVAFALRAKVTLQDEGKPVTKKSVSDAAEIQRATWSLMDRGQPVTAESVKRERMGIKWNWKRIWKKHPDLECLPGERGGAPSKRKQGTK